MFLFADEQVPNSYSAEQIADFQAGLAISGVKEYILIKEADAIAVEYGYERNLNNEFENPVTVLFVGRWVRIVSSLRGSIHQSEFRDAL